MQEKEFIKEFSDVLLGKGVNIDVGTLGAYYRKLNNLEYLHELLDYVRENTFYKDASQRYPRMPQVSEMLLIHKSIKRRKDDQNIKPIAQIGESSSNFNHVACKEYRKLSILCTDCMKYLNLNPKSVMDSFIENVKDFNFETYLQVSRNMKSGLMSVNDFSSYMKDVLKDSYDSISRISPKGNVFAK